jgi:glutamate N-acetyltransferase/amino-acid N-acetyltransferase
MSVTAAEGFIAGGMHCGVKTSRPDLALLVTDDARPVSTAAVFTQNRFRAPPVTADVERMASTGGMIAGVVVNSGNANAGTGEPGRRDAEAISKTAAQAVGCAPEAMLVCSTGLIGEPLPIHRILAAIPTLAGQLSRDGGLNAAQGILTTDSRTKEVTIIGEGFTVGGMAKGCGMINPNMATMLAYLTTDAAVAPSDLQRILSEAVDDTFNTLSVDGATSTNDTVILMASGRRGPAPPRGGPRRSRCASPARPATPRRALRPRPSSATSSSSAPGTEETPTGAGCWARSAPRASPWKPTAPGSSTAASE